MNSNQPTNSLNLELDQILQLEHSVVRREDVVTAPDGAQMLSSTIEVSAVSADGNPLAVILSGRGVQPNGTIVAAAEAKGYCTSCHSFTSEVLPPCTRCGRGVCPYCSVQDDDGNVYHRRCYRKRQLWRFLVGVLGLPFRILVALLRKEKA